MGVVVRAKIQTIEDMYRLIRTAVTARRAISARYDRLPRLLCPHRLGRNSAGQARVLCYQYGGESSTELEPIGSQDVLSMALRPTESDENGSGSIGG